MKGEVEWRKREPTVNDVPAVWDHLFKIMSKTAISRPRRTKCDASHIARLASAADAQRANIISGQRGQHSPQ